MTDERRDASPNDAGSYVVDSSGTRASRPSWWRAALVGLLAGAVALAVGELVAGLFSDGRSPVVAVGDVVIDNVPSGVKDLAIDLFGTNDKIALVVGILVILALVASAIGVLAARRLAVGAAGIALFGVVGTAASFAAEPEPSFVAAVAPSTIGALAGMGALSLGLRSLRRPTATAMSTGEGAGPTDRRRFLLTGVGLASVAVGAGSVGRFLQGRVAAGASRAGVVLGRAASPLPAVVAGADLGIRDVAPFVTPNRDFYRIDTALAVPQVRAEDWSLRVHGMVDNELEIDFASLMERPLVEADITMTCVSNEVGGVLAGNARWLGVRLADVLDEAGVQRGATQLVGRSVDGFTAGFPTQVAMDGRDALIAVGMNGEPLPIEHGFPARLVVPGLYGYVSATKWLQELELTRMEDFDAYWVRRGWAKEAPIKTASRIDTPRGFARLAPGEVVVAGVAWAQTRGIRAVEVQVDDEPWQEAELADEVNLVTWRQWRHRWSATPGNHTLRVRATDASGATQPEERVPPIPDGATGWHSVTVRVDDA